MLFRSAQANLYAGANRAELGMIYHFDHAVPREEHRFLDPAPELTLPELKTIFSRWNTALETGPDAPGWQNVYFGNHDNPRVLSRFGSPERFRHESGTLLATVLLTQRGTPGIYQGDEIGMSNYPFSAVNEFDDIQVKNAYNALVMNGVGSAETFLRVANHIARDHARTPMQWANQPGGGFTTGQPWLPINPNLAEVNVQSQQINEESILAFYKRLIRFRKQTPAFQTGSYRDLLPQHPRLWVFERTLGTARYVTVANFSDETVPFPPGEATGVPVLTNYTNAQPGAPLRPWEARVLASATA